MHHRCRIAAVAWKPGPLLTWIVPCQNPDRHHGALAPSEKGSAMNTPTTSTGQQYLAPGLVDLGPATEVTLGKYAEDSQDQGRYFE